MRGIPVRARPSPAFRLRLRSGRSAALHVRKPPTGNWLQTYRNQACRILRLSSTASLQADASLRAQPASLCDAVDVVDPPLHHLAALRQVLRVVVGGPHFVLFDVGELAFNHV